jgi:hypothetical protein
MRKLISAFPGLPEIRNRFEQLDKETIIHDSNDLVFIDIHMPEGFGNVHKGIDNPITVLPAHNRSPYLSAISFTSFGYRTLSGGASDPITDKNRSFVSISL